MDNHQKYFNVREVASILGVHPETIRELCRKGPQYGGLRAVKIGTGGRTSPYRIPESAIAEWERRNANHPGFG